MKKSISVVLALLVVFSLFGCVTAFAVYEPEIICEDTYPITIKEVEAAEYTPVFYLGTSVFDYKFRIKLPDGTYQFLNDDKKNDKNTDTAPSDTMYTNHGYAYIEFDDVKKAWDERVNDLSAFVPVHVVYTVSEKVSGTDTYKVIDDYSMVVYKYLAPSYVTSFTLVKNAPQYIYEESESVNLSTSEFQITYWNGTPETLTPEIRATEEKIYYTLGDAELVYDVNHKTSKVYIAYLDSSCYVDIGEIREFPFESIELIECELKGDMPVKLVYQINRIGQPAPERYTKEVNAYSGYIDFIDGYPVSYSTEGSKYVSTVEVSVGNILKASKTYEMEQQGFLQKLIAKIVMFFKAIFSAGIF